ncbi:MAG: N-acetyl-gamma-glutamyl-phosphate reductase [Candidatus Scalindua sp. AMX11]|nr:MAG: N-acetyl-gamma-glutamyl-phosphate reductase [Candidatus Scalindua sp.]NOG83519.1 N-acetyl-gamma-glutamyl-phosphate reductase [Planctomycetota bacterium]RZV72075.1 MAG: N-acetyl-gamma-glutamyl-phosphate reductase [Candidatus Scalindua sp. SCAELEC01]TDE64374.1 MAG: N-acetyl-gamma-glutamyl-phosphate reductase [Candidatus Scalindua sp. AMX11]GJQ59879.1 MAG: N-acetyl-gamma-glutamyl-phosphate reductase [Candidatus Scalindua sp.]
MTKVGIVGATAYTSLELIKILLRHPESEISYLGTRRMAGTKISEIFPVLTKIFEMPCSPLGEGKVPGDVDLVFMALPPTVSMQFVPQFLDAGIKVVDLSADYRFAEKSVYERWYKVKHTDPSHLKAAVYGLPELFRDKIETASLVANPGCYPTAAILGLAPLIKRDLIDTDDIIIDAKSGISGSGRTPTEATHYCERNENLEAYNVGVHRHTPEIESIVSLMGNSDPFVYFTPHLIPMIRGLLCSIYVQLKKEISNEEIRDLFNNLYGGEPFVRLSRDGTFPKTKDVTNTNMCEIAVKVVGKRVLIFSSIDNLMKGASGQAVQNMNIMCGHNETMGLI